MQPSSFSHEQNGGAGQHGGFYGQQAGAYGTSGAPHHAAHAGVHSGYGGYAAHPTHGDQSPSMSYLQPGGGHSGHMGMYGGYAGHYPTHHATPQQQQHYSHVNAAAFGTQPGSGQSILGGNAVDYQGGVHPASYSHMAPQHGMYYQDAGGMMHPAHAHNMMGSAGTIPGSGYSHPGALVAPAPSAAGGKGGNKAARTAAPGGRKGSVGGSGSGIAATSKKTSGGAKATKAQAQSDALAAAAAAGVDPNDPVALAAMGIVLDPSTAGKVKSSKISSGSDRHHPYAAVGGGAPTVEGGDKKDKASKKKEKEPAKPPVLKSHLKPPKQAPSAWQVYFTEELQKIKAEQPGARLNVAHVAKDAGQRYAALPEEKKQEFQRRSQEAKAQWEQDMLDWKSHLTPEDIKQENMFRTAQRKAGKSRKGNLKDPNAPKKPLSAYFLFLRAIRADPKMTEDVFHGEQETTKQSVLAAAKWRSLEEPEKQPFLEKAEADKVEYERLRKEYEATSGISGGDGHRNDSDDAGSNAGGAGEYGSYDQGEGGVPPSMAAGGGGDEAFKLDGHFGLGEDAVLGFSGKDEGGFGLEG